MLGRNKFQKQIFSQMVPLMVIYHGIESVKKTPTKQIQMNEDVFQFFFFGLPKHFPY